MRERIFIFIFFLLAVSSFASSQESGTKSLTLNEAISLALKNNVSVKRKEITLEASKRASEHSWNSLLPSLSASANNEINLPDLDASDTAGKNEVQNNFGVEGKIALSISADFFASIQKAKLDYEADRISFDETVFEIISQVKETYFSLILSKQNLDFMKENLENAKNQAKQSEERYRRGTLSEVEYLSSKVSYEKLKPELKSKELSFKKDIKSFCLFLGLDDEKIILSGSLEDFIGKYAAFFDEPKKNLVAEDVRNGNIPSIILLKKQIESSQKGVQAARLASYGPSANLSYSVNPMIAGNDAGRIKQSASLGVSIPLENLLPFSKGADSIKTAQDSVKDLMLLLAEKQKSVSADFSHIIESLAQKEESVALMKDFVQLARKNYETAKYSYSKGMTEFLSMQNASKENLESKLSLQNELLESLKLYISLEKLCGKSAYTLTEE